MRRLGTVIVITTTVIAYACGGGSETKKDAGIDSHKRDAGIDAPEDASVDAPPDAPGTFVELTVRNYSGWCDVQIGTRTFTPATETIVYNMPGVTTLTAKPNGSAYELGSNMWHLTDGDPGYGSGSSTNESLGEAGSQTGSGSAAQSVAKATLAAGSAKCVWVCCPNANGTGCDGLPEQCTPM